MPEKKLILIDSIINLALGLLLGLYPKTVISFLGMPLTDSGFYPGILGGVLFGIGVALLLEWKKEKTGLNGLGLGGAIAINISGGIVLALWLIFGGIDVSLKGFIIMWGLVTILFVISTSELLNIQKKRNKSNEENTDYL